MFIIFDDPFDWFISSLISKKDFDVHLLPLLLVGLPPMKNECAFALAFALMYEVSLRRFVFCRFSCFVEFKQKLRVYEVEKDGIHVAVLCAK